jgi:hypothetical protein
MSPQEIEAMKAAFLAKGGKVTQAAPGVAYGVDEEADKAKRKAAHDQRAYDAIEREAENRFQRGVEETHIRRFYGRA